MDGKGKSTRNEHTTAAVQMPHDLPTSPWTETFQNAELFSAIQAGRQNQRSQQASGAEQRTIPAHADSDATRPTQDALSEIFNGV